MIGRTNSGSGGGGALKTITVDLYSAANDTVSYTNPFDGLSHTVTTDASGHALAEIAIRRKKTASVTFESSVAKNPTALENYYSKSIVLTEETTSIYVMPDDFIYWYGALNSAYGAGDLKSLGYTANIEDYAMANVSFGTNSFVANYTKSTKYTAGVGTNIQVDLSHFSSICAIIDHANSGASGKFNNTFYNTNKRTIRQTDGYITTTSMTRKVQNITDITTSAYVGINVNYANDAPKPTIYALWLE